MHNEHYRREPTADAGRDFGNFCRTKPTVDLKDASVSDALLSFPIVHLQFPNLMGRMLEII